MGGRQSLTNCYNNHTNQRSRHTNASNVNLPTALPTDCCLLCQQAIKQEQQQHFLSASSTSVFFCSSASLCCIGARTQLSNFSLLCEIGRGTYGKVYIVLHRIMGCHYALKCTSKRRIIHKSMGTNVIRELELLQNLNHTFITNLWFTFQDEDYVFVISDLLLGGDLRQHLHDSGRFSEARAKLYVCEIALALDYLHQRHIAHRDVKPENLLLDTGGHAHLTDFNLAVKIGETPDGHATSFSGTRLYMAPEVLKTSLAQLTGYDQSVDWWSLGVSFFEMIHGRRPFEFPSSFSSLQVLQLISGNLGIPAHWTSDLSSFVTSLLKFDLQKRINSFEKFKSHYYMKRINMDHILFRKTAPVYVPKQFCNGTDKKDNHLPHSYPLKLRMQRHNFNNSLISLRVRCLRQNGLSKTTTSTPQHETTHSDSFQAIEKMRRRGPAAVLNRRPFYQKNQQNQESSQQLQRENLTWMVKIAHLTLSFQEYNRFLATPLEQPVEPKVKRQSNLLINCSVPANTIKQPNKIKNFECFKPNLSYCTQPLNIKTTRCHQHCKASNAGHVNFLAQSELLIQTTPPSAPDLMALSLTNKINEQKKVNWNFFASTDNLAFPPPDTETIKRRLSKSNSDLITKEAASVLIKNTVAEFQPTVKDVDSTVLAATKPSKDETICLAEVQENLSIVSNVVVETSCIIPLSLHVACVKRLVFSENRE